MRQSRNERLGRVEWFDLTVTDAEPVRAFYEKVTGWTADPLSMGDYNDYCMQAKSGDVVAGICHARGANQGLPAQWILYINVDNLEQSLQACQSAGGKVLGSIREQAGSGRYCLIEDPAGATCALYEPQ